MLNSSSAWNWWNFEHNIMRECENPLFLPTDRITDIFFVSQLL